MLGEHFLQAVDVAARAAQHGIAAGQRVSSDSLLPCCLARCLREVPVFRSGAHAHRARTAHRALTPTQETPQPFRIAALSHSRVLRGGRDSNPRPPA